MSKENLEVVRTGWRLWQQRDVSGLFDLWDTKIVWDMTNFRDWPESAYEGPDGVSRFLTEWLEVWGEIEVSIDEMRLAPDGRVVTLARQQARGTGSGLGMEMEWIQIATVRNGKVTRIDNYSDRAEALEAAGLSE